MNSRCPACQSLMTPEKDHAYHDAPVCPYCWNERDRSVMPLQEKILSALQEIKDHHRTPQVVELKERFSALIFPHDRTFNSLAASAIFFDLIVQDEDYRRYVLDHYDLLKWFLERIAHPLPRVTDEEIEPLLEPGGVALADWLAFELPQQWQKVAVRTFLLRNPQASLGEFLQAAEEQGKRIVDILKKFAEKTDASEERAYERALTLLEMADPESRDRFLQQVRKADPQFAGRMERDLLASLPTTTLAPFVRPAGNWQEVSPVSASSTIVLPLPVPIVVTPTPPAPSDLGPAVPISPGPAVPQPLPVDVPVPYRRSVFRRVLPLAVICILLLGDVAIAIYYIAVLRPLTSQTISNLSATNTSLANQNTLLQSTVTTTMQNAQATATALAGGVFGASFLGQAPLASVQAGDSVQLYFVLQNTGTSTWSQSGGYQFICVSDLPQNQSSQYIASCLGATSPSPLGNYLVLPQQYYAFYFTVYIPPSAPSRTIYRTQWEFQSQTQTSDMGYITLVVK